MRPLLPECPRLLSVCSEDVVFAAAKVCMYLARKDGIFGYICLATVFVQGEEEKPCNADQDAYGGEVWRKLEEDW